MKSEYDRVVYEEVKAVCDRLDEMEKRMQARADTWAVVIIMTMIIMGGIRLALGMI